MLNFEKNIIKNLCLIGLMGSGKSVIGKDLSKKLDIAFIDTDTEIEKELGLTIDLIYLRFIFSTKYHLLISAILKTDFLAISAIL